MQPTERHTTNSHGPARTEGCADNQPQDVQATAGHADADWQRYVEQQRRLHCPSCGESGGGIF